MASLSYMILQAKDDVKAQDPKGMKPDDDQVPSAALATPKSKSKSKSKSKKQAYRSSIYGHNLYTSKLTRQKSIPEESSKNKMSAENRTIHRKASQGMLAPVAPKRRDSLEKAGLVQELIIVKTIIAEDHTVPELDNDAGLGQEYRDAAADSPANVRAVWKSVGDNSKEESCTNEVSPVVSKVLRNAWKEIVTIDDQEPLPCSCHIAEAACVYHLTPNDKDEEDVLTILSFQADITWPKSKPPWTSSVHIFEDEEDEEDEIWNYVDEESKAESSTTEVNSDFYHVLRNAWKEIVVTMDDQVACAHPSAPNDKNEKDILIIPCSSQVDITRPKPKPPLTSSVHVFRDGEDEDDGTMKFADDEEHQHQHPQEISTIVCRSESTQNSVTTRRDPSPDAATGTFFQEQRLLAVQRISAPNAGAPVPPASREESNNTINDAKKKPIFAGLSPSPLGDDDQDAKSVSGGTQQSSNLQESECATFERVKRHEMGISYTSVDRETSLHVGFYSGALNERGQMDGHGVFWFDNGDFYLGQFSDGDLHGVGALSLSKRDKKGKQAILKGFFEHNRFMGERMAIPRSTLPSLPPRRRQRGDPQQVVVPQPTNNDDSNRRGQGLTHTSLAPSPATHNSNSPRESLSVAATRRDPSPDAATGTFFQEQRLLAVQRISAPNAGAPVPPASREESNNTIDDAKKKPIFAGLPPSPFDVDDQDAKSASGATQQSSNLQESECATFERVTRREMGISYTSVDRETSLHVGFYSGALNERGQMDGHGVFWFDNGDFYLGQFSDGDLHGVGALSLSRRDKKEKQVILNGCFEYNQFMGERMVE